MAEWLSGQGDEVDLVSSFFGHFATLPLLAPRPGLRYGNADMMRRAWSQLAAAVLLLAGLAGVVQAEDAAVSAPSEPVIRADMDVGVEYVLTVDGVVVDSTEGQGSWHYIHGHQQMIHGLERQLEGLHVGDERDMTVSPAEGYGEVDPTLFVEIPTSDLPPDTLPTVGMVLRGVNPDGKSFQARITEIKPDTVILDLNDPLAGRTLHFTVKVTDITPIPSK